MVVLGSRVVAGGVVLGETVLEVALTGGAGSGDDGSRAIGVGEQALTTIATNASLFTA
jgi:hypothetical protein